MKSCANCVKGMTNIEVAGFIVINSACREHCVEYSDWELDPYTEKQRWIAETKGWKIKI